MRFGLFGGAKVGGSNPLGDSYGYRDFVDYVCAAEEVGAEGAFLVEHHFTGAGQLSASLNLLTYLAAKTRRIRLGTAVVVLPWHNPVLLAEQVATVDVLSEGRLDLGVGRGYRSDEFAAFCIPMSEAQERYQESFELLLRSLTSRERFSHHGRWWNFENIVVEPPPMQRPHPPVWMAAGTPGGIAYVASKGYNVLFDQLGTVDETTERVRLFLDAREKAGLPRDARCAGVTRALHIVGSRAERERAYARRLETLSRIGELSKKPQPATFAEVDIANDDAALIGTPEEIAERLQRLADGGVEYVLFTSATADRATLETLATRIMPHVKTRDTTPA